MWESLGSSLGSMYENVGLRMKGNQRMLSWFNNVCLLAGGGEVVATTSRNNRSRDQLRAGV